MDFVNLLLVFAGFLVLFVGAAIGSAAAQLLISRSISARLDSLENSIKGSAGRQIRQIKEDRLAVAMAEAMQKIQAGADPQTTIKEIAAKYPDVALEFVKKLNF